MWIFEFFIGMSRKLSASTDSLFVDFFWPFDVLFFRVFCFLRSGPFRDIRRLDFCFLLVSIFPDDLCTANMGERNFSSLIRESSRQEGEVLCVFFFFVFLRVCRLLLPVFRSSEERTLRKIFGSELWFSSACVRSLFFRVVLLRFFLDYVDCFSPESSLKNSLLVRCALWQNFWERTFVFLPLCPVGVF